MGAALKVTGGGEGSYECGAFADADGDACVPTPEPAPEAVVGAGLVTVGLLAGAADVRAPNQFHCVKPKNSRISTRRARIAAVMPAPAPLVVSLVSTTSDPAGLQ